MLRKLLLPVLAAALLSACQSTKFDPKAASGLDTIALIGPADPQRYVIDFDGNAENGFYAGGLITYLIVASIDAANSTDEYDAPFTEALVGQQKLRLGSELQAAIKQQLEATGYIVTTEAAPDIAAPEAAAAAAPAATTEATPPDDTATDKAAADNTTAASAPSTSKMARLMIAFEFVGYIDQAFMPFEPTMLVTATMHDGATRKELFRQRYNYSPQDFQIEDVVFRPDEKYEFRKEEDLLADPARAADGFRAAIPLIAADIAKKLKKG